MLKKILWYLLILISLVWQMAFAQEEQTQFLGDFLVGSYTIIGRWCDSDSTYQGRVKIMAEPTTSGQKSPLLRIVRTVKGNSLKAVGRLRKATADNVTVLKIQFEQNGRQYEGTFLIGSDLDNYGRLSGYIYLKNGRTKQPGLEAWFIRRERRSVK